MDLTLYIFSAIAALIALTAHEFSHALAAYRLGDPTAAKRGRLTLNPLRHLDVFGVICVVLFRFGWAKPVPIDPRNFRKPRLGFALSSLAGPLCNLLLSFLGAFLYFLIYFLCRGVAFESEFLLDVVQNFIDFFYIFHVVNLGFAIFNMLPIPPLDGSRLFGLLLPPKAYFKYLRAERTIYFILLAWLLFGYAASYMFTLFPALGTVTWLRRAVEYLSLTHWIGWLIDRVSHGMLSLLAFFFGL